MINLEPISKKIQERMFEKMRVLGRTSKAVPNKGKNGELTTEKMSSRTTFLRMTSGQTNAVALVWAYAQDTIANADLLMTTNNVVVQCDINRTFEVNIYRSGGGSGTAGMSIYKRGYRLG